MIPAIYNLLRHISTQRYVVIYIYLQNLHKVGFVCHLGRFVFWFLVAFSSCSLEFTCDSCRTTTGSGTIHESSIVKSYTPKVDSQLWRVGKTTPHMPPLGWLPQKCVTPKIQPLTQCVESSIDDHMVLIWAVLHLIAVSSKFHSMEWSRLR